jgi:leucyl/phenylalanyl-tRNA--protein transferase
MPNLQPLTPEVLLTAYASGYFPMAQTRHGEELFWFAPKKRGVIPLDGFHIPRSLKKFLKTSPYHITVDMAFPDVIRACADTRSEIREDSWINEEIIALYTELWRQGHAHSVETWQGQTLVGGLYGVSLGGAFFGESMFSHAQNASKAALVRLVEILRSAEYLLLDTQYVNEHLKQFGVVEIPRGDYLRSLEAALSASPSPSMRFRTASESSDSMFGAR